MLNVKETKSVHLHILTNIAIDNLGNVLMA